MRRRTASVLDADALPCLRRGKDYAEAKERPAVAQVHLLLLRAEHLRPLSDQQGRQPGAQAEGLFEFVGWGEVAGLLTRILAVPIDFRSSFRRSARMKVSASRSKRSREGVPGFPKSSAIKSSMGVQPIALNSSFVIIRFSFLFSKIFFHPCPASFGRSARMKASASRSKRSREGVPFAPY